MKRKRNILRKVIAYSLFETTDTHPIDRDLYRCGVVINSINCQRYFPDWEIYLYHDQSVNENILKISEKLSNVTLFPVDYTSSEGSFIMTTARFLAANDTNIDVVLFRDLDTELSPDDYNIIEQWITTNTICHRYKLPNYKHELAAGSIAIRPKLFNSLFHHPFFNFKKFLNNFDGDYGCDEHFLDGIIYPLLKDKHVTTTVINKSNNNVLVQIEDVYDRIEWVLLNERK